MTTTTEARSLDEIASEATIALGAIMRHLPAFSVHVGPFGARVLIAITAHNLSNFEQWRALLRDSAGQADVRVSDKGSLHADYTAFDAHVTLFLPAKVSAA